VAVAVPENALKKREKVREFALGLPGAVERFPRGESVAKAGKKVFVLLTSASIAGRWLTGPQPGTR
jgi:hypothetical protein